MIDSVTRDELVASLKRYRWIDPEHEVAELFKDIESHREPEYFIVGEIYEDAKGRRLLRRPNDLWPWQIITYVKGDPMTHDGRDFGTLHLEQFPERPLRKLVPEE